MRKSRPVLALALGILAVTAAAPIGAEERIDAKAPIDAQEKIRSLRQASSELAALARQPLPADLDAAERSRAVAYDRWLEEASARLKDLADRWESALSRPTDAGDPVRGSVEGRQTARLRPPAGSSGGDSRVELDTASPSPPSEATDPLTDDARRMHEMNRSFNLQYLQLQNSIQQKTREFNLISNIMKTRHDAAKAAINNVR